MFEDPPDTPLPLLYDDKAGVMGDARLTVKVAPQNRYFYRTFNELTELDQMARAMVPPYTSN
jgi:hypothetical protein